MKVLHITVNYPTDHHPIFGIFVKEQIQSIETLGVKCEVYFSNGLELSGKKTHIESIKHVRHILKNNNFDIIHCHHSISALILLLSGYAFKNKCIVSYQNDPTREFGGMFLFRLLYIFFNKIIIKNSSDLIKLRKVVYLPNGVNDKFFKPMNKSECRKQLGLDIDKKYILYMDSNAGKRTQKRYDRYIEVLNIITKQYCNVTPLVLTNTPRNLIPLYMNACDLHLLTSDFEGSPNSIKECICCNTPVVSTNVGNVRDMIADIPGCYVDDSFTSAQLAKYVSKVFDSDSKFYGRELFLKKGYGIHTVACKLKELYETIK